MNLVETPNGKEEVSVSNGVEGEKSFFNPEFLIRFIEKYKNLPCLWNLKADHSNGATRKKAWEDLVQFSKQINPKADIPWVKKKVQAMRGALRKEKRKIAASNNNSGGTEELYKPKLWYYEHLLFIKNEETPKQCSSSLEDKDEILIEDSYLPVECIMQEESPTTDTENVNASIKKRKYKREDQHNGEFQALIQKANVVLDKEDDEYDSHGKTIAAKLRRIASGNYDQFLLADNLLNQVLHKALKNQLTEDSVITHTNSRPAAPY